LQRLQGTPNGKLTAFNVLARVKDGPIDPQTRKVLQQIAREYAYALPDPLPESARLTLPLLIGAIRRGIELDRSRFRQEVTLHSLFLGTVELGADVYVLFSTVFDGSAESYFDETIEAFGERIDAAWRHCEGYEGLDSERFRAFIAAHQIDPHGDTAAFYVANQLSAVDVAVLAREVRRRESGG
jgi:hypothetical protein